MSTRSKAKSSGTTGKAISTNGSLAKPKTRRQVSKANDDMDVDTNDGKENINSKAPAKHSSSVSTKKGKVKKEATRLPPVDCICTRGDDGSPMIYCSECKIWFHFTCVDISEPEAEEISVYICPTCTASTRRRSAMTWEGDQAIEECSDDEATIQTRRKTALKSRKRYTELSPEPQVLPEESEESAGSEDEYVEDKEENVVKSKVGKRIAHRRQSTVSDTDSAEEGGKRRLSRAKVSASPAPSVQHSTLKRKATIASVSHPSPAHKRKRSESSQSQDPADDPARKYCLGKLEELFQDIFLRYPHVHVAVQADDGGNDERSAEKYGTKIVQKNLGELSEEEKNALINEAHQFAHELESCVFEIYSEPDKSGQPHAGGKYKERFRMLQFNLSKVDRVIIHQRITSGTISPKEISLMSSTDLADEETKQSIKQAEKEALEHSILLKSTVPRAKITHKGLQDIEDVNMDVTSARELERLKEREQEEEERRERERMARLRTVQSQRQRTASISVPPESPTVQQTPPSEQEWGAPPPVPPHAMSPVLAKGDEASSVPSRPPLFLQTSSDFIVSEPELNLADLINIDEEQEPTSTIAEQDSTTIFTPLPPDISQPSPTTATPTGISPFAARQDKPRVGSFDLSALWNGPKEESPVPTLASLEDTGVEGSDKDDAMDLESVEANDQDFDMFLEENPPEPPSDLIVTPIPMKDVESLPEVWSGKITMPLDSTVPQETVLVARQVAGRTLAPDSPLWHTLFPVDQLRIEGRVPVDNSTKYLLQMRMNASKELYAAAFVPAAAENAEDFKTFCNFLISKKRHGLVFPWGNRPKEYHPGRELYMIPLPQSDPLPEFVELLDDLKMPKTRSRDYLLGVWVLNKGKLAPLPGTLVPSAPPHTLPQPTIQPGVQPPQQISTPPVTRTPPVNLPMFNTPPASVPQIPQIAALSSQHQPMPAIAPALAAEVASLTPEQLQEVLRTLAATTQIPLPPLPSQMPPTAQQLPPSFAQSRPPFPPHIATPPIPNHTPVPPNPPTWMPALPPPGAPGGYPISYPPPSVPFQQPPHSMNTPPPHPQPYDGHEYDRDFRPGPHYSQGNRGPQSDRGRRGNAGYRGGNRGRGRGGGSGGGDGYERDFNTRRPPSDSGWPRRSRNDSHGGPAW
ncbi:hypothetical protein CPB84DRAFT_1770475 [Gymnopilus junonius]|uniref:Transcription factor BYE1 n=1 Tax=Gymnopilus junonius TaxID=109634 RepID=A0A9P5NV41_GYMJU|nr:hypothetical protein CPB84DRAFT_1770475 [Gymnopilus junonius]